MHTELAMKLNFEGRGGMKTGIKSMKIISVIFGK
jgi:hypothetical protein